MTQQEFLLDMLQYYTVDPEARRNISDVGCKYSPRSTGKEGSSEGCAIGRKLTEKDAFYIDKKIGNVSIMSLLMNYEKLLLPKYMRTLGCTYLTSIQGLHDNDLYWNKSGLTEGGRSKVMAIVREFSLDDSAFAQYLPSDKIQG